MYLNQVNLVGRLTHTPSKYLKALPSGKAVLSMSIANNRKWKNAEGQQQEVAEFHDIVMFGRTAEICAQYCLKGQEILVTGRLQTRSWDDKDGNKRYKTEVIVDNMQMGQKPQNAGANDGVDAEPHEDGNQDVPPPANAPQQASGGIEYPTEDINPDDIPF